MADEKLEPIRAPAREQVRERLVFVLLEAAKPSKEELEAIAPLWTEDRPVLDALVLSLARFRPDVRGLIESSATDAGSSARVMQFIADPAVDPFVRANVGVYLARDFLRRHWVDEALTLLDSVPTGEVADPASLYFFQAVCRFQLQRRNEALDAMDQLKRVEAVPERYRAVAEMMRTVLDPLTPESLSGIAHDMRDVRRRLDLGRTDQKVQEEQKDILARLDKLIKDLEEQQKQAQSQGSLTPSAPADESRAMGGEGEGKVRDRAFDPKGAWGNLPEKERERAMQELGREFPAHYRDAIEQYFRKLAGNRREP